MVDGFGKKIIKQEKYNQNHQVFKFLNYVVVTLPDKPHLFSLSFC
jgi:hypothetical protein